MKHPWPSLIATLLTPPARSIVAVHGLNGGSRSTWTSKKTNVCWLEDPDFLPKHLKPARVLVWGYNASFSSLLGHKPSESRVHHHAHNLVSYRPLCESASKRHH